MRTVWLLMLMGAMAVAAAVGVGAGPAPLVGPDTSHYQGEVDWTKMVRETNTTYAFAKASEGVRFVDPFFTANWHGMRRAGIRVRGAYHFGRPAEGPAGPQADNFLAAVAAAGGFRSGDFAVLDIEDADRAAGPEAFVAWCAAWVDAVRTKSGLPSRRVVLYTGAWFWNPAADGHWDALSTQPLWVSSYRGPAATRPLMPKGWSGYTFWQFTDSGSIAGVSGPVDLSRFEGTLEELERLFAR